MKEIRSKVAPNHMECNVWVDLKSDPQGSVKKYWNGTKWTETKSEFKSIEDTVKQLELLIKSLSNEIKEVKQSLSMMTPYDDSRLHNRINKLNNRIEKIEKLIED